MTSPRGAAPWIWDAHRPRQAGADRAGPPGPPGRRPGVRPRRAPRHDRTWPATVPRRRRAAAPAVPRRPRPRRRPVPAPTRAARARRTPSRSSHWVDGEDGRAAAGSPAGPTCAKVDLARRRGRHRACCCATSGPAPSASFPATDAAGRGVPAARSTTSGATTRRAPSAWTSRWRGPRRRAARRPLGGPGCGSRSAGFTVTRPVDAAAAQRRGRRDPGAPPGRRRPARCAEWRAQPGAALPRRPRRRRACTTCASTGACSPGAWPATGAGDVDRVAAVAGPGRHARHQARRRRQRSGSTLPAGALPGPAVAPDLAVERPAARRARRRACVGPGDLGEPSRGTRAACSCRETNRNGELVVDEWQPGATADEVVVQRRRLAAGQRARVSAPRPASAWPRGG